MKQEEKKKEFPTSWEAPLTKETYIGLGVPPIDDIYVEVHVVGHYHGVTLSFERRDRTDHLIIYLEPQDARAIGQQLVKKAGDVISRKVMERLRKEGR